MIPLHLQECSTVISCNMKYMNRTWSSLHPKKYQTGHWGEQISSPLNDPMANIGGPTNDLLKTNMWLFSLECWSSVIVISSYNDIMALLRVLSFYVWRIKIFLFTFDVYLTEISFKTWNNNKCVIKCCQCFSFCYLNEKEKCTEH